MKFTTLVSLLAVAAAAPLGSSGLRDYIIVFEKGLETPDKIVKEVANTLKQVGAQINYEYHSVIKGFSVSLPEAAIGTVKNANNDEYPFVIEEDQEVQGF